MAFAFGEIIKDCSLKDSKTSEKLWNLCSKWTNISPVEAPVNSQREFPPFCGAYAIGVIGSVSPMFFRNAFSRLKELASDSRWRTRESVAMGIQKLIERQGQQTLNELEGWMDSGKWLQIRAVAAGVAEPRLLKKEETAERALELHKKIIARVVSSKERRSAEFKILRQALGYSLSVVVSAVPKEGFEYLNQLALSQDADIVWILRENLKKNRLVKSYPKEITMVKKLLA